MVYWEPLTLGKLVRARRIALQLTQVQLAERLDVDQTLISSMEREMRRTLPDRHEMARYARALECTVRDMMDDLGYKDMPDDGTSPQTGDLAIYTQFAVLIEGLTLPDHAKKALQADIEWIRKRFPSEAPKPLQTRLTIEAHQNN